MLNLSLLFATSMDTLLLAKGVAMGFLAGYIGVTATWVLLGVASLVLLALVSYVAVISTMKLFSFAKSYFQNANNEGALVVEGSEAGVSAGPEAGVPAAEAKTEGPEAGVSAGPEAGVPAAAEAKTEGPAAEAKTEGPAAEAKTEGPAAEAKTEGPAAEAKTEGPAAAAKTEGPAAAAKTEGPAAAAKTEGPAAAAKVPAPEAGVSAAPEAAKVQEPEEGSEAEEEKTEGVFSAGSDGVFDISPKEDDRTGQQEENSVQVTSIVLHESQKAFNRVFACNMNSDSMRDLLKIFCSKELPTVINLKRSVTTESSGLSSNSEMIMSRSRVDGVSSEKIGASKVSSVSPVRINDRASVLPIGGMFFY